MRVVRPDARTCRELYTPLFCNSIFVYTVHTLIIGISMVAPAKQSKHRERSQWTARDNGYVLATLALARVVTRNLVVSQNKNFGRNPSWSYVQPVVNRGSTVLPSVMADWAVLQQPDIYAQRSIHKSCNSNPDVDDIDNFSIILTLQMDDERQNLRGS
jgi:hypothetical protein